ncbi:MAG: preprotein translocase subunit YajC [Gammaproteobacteria bacterium]|nr:preprotein translocase subunit YajC [Gammaproteobacteria bacterium]
MEVFVPSAHAQAGGGGAGISSLIMIVGMFAVFYFLLIRPQQKRQKEHKAMIDALAKGEEVITNGGLLGKVTDLNDNFITLEIAKGAEVKVQRHAIANIVPKGTIKSA